MAIVTGASQGIGRAIALRLAALGATVVAAARSENGLQILVAEIARRGGRALACPTDVRSPAAVDALARFALQQCGQVDILVNNAGVGRFGVPLHLTPPEAWTATLETNLSAVYYAIRALAPHMIARASGQIINVASLAAHNPLPNGAAYAASKAALHQLTVSVAEELRAHRIRVSLVCPGSVDTDLSPELVGNKNRARMLRPDDVAHVVAMLVTQSEQSFVSEVLIRPTQKP
ncbi:MAG: SDR family oxidoreductase [Terriglobales bacterium]